MKNAWYKNAVFYQIYPRSFADSNGDGIGDLNGILSKVDYLKELGIDAVWFSPLYASPNSDFGYDISDYKAINPEYGTMQQFEAVVEALHTRNIKVIMDLVVNHTSDQHSWFVQSKSSTDNEYRDYYYWRTGKHGNKRPPNNWTSFFTGSAWQYDEHTKQWYLHLFDKNQPDLNYHNPKVIAEIKDILRFWLDKGVDGFRCDVITLLAKTQGLPDGKRRIALTGSEYYLDGKQLDDILGQFQTDVLQKYDAFTVGESVFIDVPKALRYTAGEHPLLDTVFAFDHVSADNYFGIKQLVKRFSLKHLKKCIERWQHGLYNKSWNTLFWENHDQARIVGRYCSDKVHREEGAKMLATLLLTLTGTPFIYQGQEIGSTSIRMQAISQYQDVDSIRSYKLLKKLFGKKGAIRRIAYCSRDNARTPMQWSDDKNAGFSTADKTWLPVNPNYKQINVCNDINNADSVYHYYRKLIALRKTHTVLNYGDYCPLLPNNKHLLCFEKHFNNSRLLVVLNFSLQTVRFAPPKKLDTNGYKLLTSNYKDSADTPCKCKLRPYEALVYIDEQQNPSN